MSVAFSVILLYVLLRIIFFFFLGGGGGVGGVNCLFNFVYNFWVFFLFFARGMAVFLEH